MKYTPYIIIIILFAIIVYLSECRRPVIQQQDPVYITDSIVTTIHTRDTIYIPKWIVKAELKIDTIHDTIWMVQEFNTEYTVIDTLFNDARGFLSLTDVIYQNHIKTRAMSLKLNSQTIYKTKIETTPLKSRFLVGGGVYGWSDKFGFNAGIGLVNKQSNVFLLTYDPINKAVQLGYFHAIHFR